MIDLIITVCLLAAPDHCQSVTIYAAGTPEACIAAAPLTVSAWQGLHPNWRPVRVACMRRGVDA